MNAEQLQDAISLLPEEMVADVDRLRRKKPNPWKGVIAAAACICLLTGLWVLQNGGIKAESGNSAPDRVEDAGAGMEHSQDCSQTTPMEATIVKVEEDRIYVYPHSDPPAFYSQPTSVLLTELEDIPKLTENQRIRIYFMEKTNPLIPYKIEIIDE